MCQVKMKDFNKGCELKKNEPFNSVKLVQGVKHGQNSQVLA